MSGKICAVSGCPNTSGNTKGKGINFHNFPKNPEIRDLWFKALNKSYDWDPRKKLGVCSIHFTPDSYGSSEKVRVLKRSAVPSIWLPGPSYSNELEIANIPEFDDSHISIETSLRNYAAIRDDCLTTSIPVETPIPVRLYSVNLDDTDAYLPNSAAYSPLSEESACNDDIEITFHHVWNSKTTQTGTTDVENGPFLIFSCIYFVLLVMKGR